MAFHGLGTGGEDVQNDAGAIKDLALERIFQIALLPGLQVGVDHQHVRLMRASQGNRLVQLTGAHEGGGLGAADTKEGAADDLGAGGFDELGEFVQGCIGGPVAEFRQVFQAD